METKRKRILERQAAQFEHELKDRRSFLSNKGIESRRADRDTLVRKLKANLKAVHNRLKVIADNEARTAEMAKIKADKAAAPREEKKPAKGEKAKTPPAEGKVKKPKAEKKPAPAKEPEGKTETEK